MQFFDTALISVNRLINRKSDFKTNNWILDSAAFTRITTHGEHYSVDLYADQIDRWSRCGQLDAAVSQDYMCEPFILKKVNRAVEEHQHMTIERYVALKNKVKKTYIMPVIQGYTPDEYVDHLNQYNKLLSRNQWVGVGSVCKRNAKVQQIQTILLSIKKVRPDLRLHGFGLKQTSLLDPLVRSLLYSSDSMAWSFAARYEGRKSDDLKEAIIYNNKIQSIIR
jgi:hypothetical protein